MSEISHQSAKNLIQASMGGRLSVAEKEALDRHLKPCASCRAYAGQMAALEADLKQIFHSRWDMKQQPSTRVILSAQNRMRVYVMNRNIRRIAGAVMMGILLLAVIYFSVSFLPNQKGYATFSVAQFDRSPEAVVIYADIHYPGVPEPTKTPDDRYCPYLPSLRIWGDGFVFLDEQILNDYKSVLSGKLGSATLKKLFNILNSDHFFTSWQVPETNPAGTSLRIGAKMKDKPVTEYISGDLNPSVYKALIETVKPELKPLAEKSTVDKRVMAILKENENCNRYMYTRAPTEESTRSRVITYKVQEGDTIFGIAQRFGLKPETILWSNNEKFSGHSGVLHVGMVLDILPVDGTYHRWKAGDNLNDVARSYSVSPQAIVDWPGNHLDPKTLGDYSDPNIQPGTMLVIPGGQLPFPDYYNPNFPPGKDFIAPDGKVPTPDYSLPGR